MGKQEEVENGKREQEAAARLMSPNPSQRTLRIIQNAFKLTDTFNLSYYVLLNHIDYFNLKILPYSEGKKREKEIKRGREIDIWATTTWLWS